MQLPETLTQFLADPTVRKVGIAVLGLVAIFVVRGLVRRALTQRVDDTTARYRTRKLVEFVGYLVMVLFIAAVFSDRIAGLSVALGVAGAGIAFALQEVIVSVAGWITITFGKVYKVGDRVMLGGIKGDVIDVGVLRTTLFELGDWVAGDAYNGRVVRIANSFVFKEPVFNYSADFPFLWDELTIPIRHTSDRVRAQALLEEAATEITGEYAMKVQDMWDAMARNYVIEHARLQPFVTLSADENWVTFRVRYVTDFKMRRTTRDALFRRILDKIDATDGAVSIASAAQEITLMPSSAPSPSADAPGSRSYSSSSS